MTSDWVEAQTEWESFLDEIRLARAAVGATYAGAWFRGQQHSWDLTPALFRHFDHAIEELKKSESQLAKFERGLSKSRQWLEARGEAEDALTRKIKQDISAEKRKIARLEGMLPKQGGPEMQNEGRAFIEYGFRSGKSYETTWQQLAEMQHYGVPTRLLDWSESFLHALVFALQGWIQQLKGMWDADRNSKNPPKLLKFHEVDPKIDNGVSEEPVIWVLNPYKLANKAGGPPVLWDMTLSPADDYYNLFINSDRSGLSPFDLPRPILSSWNDKRIASQHGVFTCHGTNPSPLNKICSSRIVRSVQISRPAAIYGARFLVENGGFDQFTMFRDLDSLGETTRREFLDFRIE